MGNFREFGERILRENELGLLIPINRDGRRIGRDAAITGTGMPGKPGILKKLGFKVHDIINFEEVGINIMGTKGHSCMFLIGEWFGKSMVISSGRVHLYQNRGRYDEDSPLRRWLAVLIALMGDGPRRIVSTSSVGGQGEGIEDGMLVMPTDIFDNGCVPTPHLRTDNEFTSAGMPLLDPEGIKAASFARAAQEAGLKFVTGETHRVIIGCRFGNAAARKKYAEDGHKTVGMSLAPLLDAVCVEGNEITVMAVLFVTDAHDWPNHEEIEKRALENERQMAIFLPAIIKDRSWSKAP